MSETIKTYICPLPEATPGKLVGFLCHFVAGPSAMAIMKGPQRVVVSQLQSVKLQTSACSMDSRSQVPVG